MSLHITVGIPGSGKSTWANKVLLWHLVDKIICPDTIREEITGDISDQSRNKDVFDRAHSLLFTYLDCGENVIFDATNIKPSSRLQLSLLADEARCKVRIAHYFAIPWGICESRNNLRDKKVPSDVMDRMWQTFISNASPSSLQAEGWRVVVHTE